MGDFEDKSMEELMEIANDIERRCGLKVEEDIIAKASKHIASAKRAKEEREARQRAKRRATKSGKHARETRDTSPDPYREEYSHEKLIDELAKLAAMNSDLQAQCTMKDAKIHTLNGTVTYLNRELREEKDHILRLVSAREQLQLDVEDQRRKFYTVLLLSGHNEQDVALFLEKNPRSKEITDEMISVRLQMDEIGNDGRIRRSRPELVNPAVLSKRIKKLEDTILSINTVRATETTYLKGEIFTMSNEHTEIIEDMEKRIDSLAKRLCENNKILHLVLVENLKLKDSKVEIEASFNKERKRFMDLLKPHNIDHVDWNHLPSNLVRRAEADEATIKRLRNLLTRAENEMLHKSGELESFRTEFLKMERAVNRANQEKEEIRKLYEDKIVNLNTTNMILAKRAEKSDARRRFDAAGFKADIENSRTFIKTLEKRLLECFNMQCEKRMLADLGDIQFFKHAFKALIMDDDARVEVLKVLGQKFEGLKDKSNWKVKSEYQEWCEKREADKKFDGKPTSTPADPKEATVPPKKTVQIPDDFLILAKPVIKPKPAWEPVTFYPTTFPRKVKPGVPGKSDVPRKPVKSHCPKSAKLPTTLKSKQHTSTRLRGNTDGKRVDATELARRLRIASEEKWKARVQRFYKDLETLGDISVLLSDCENDENNNSTEQMRRMLDKAERNLQNVEKDIHQKLKSSQSNNNKRSGDEVAGPSTATHGAKAKDKAKLASDEGNDTQTSQTLGDDDQEATPAARDTVSQAELGSAAKMERARQRAKLMAIAVATPGTWGYCLKHPETKTKKHK